MAKTIVIRGANYSTNALDVVHLTGGVECTGITFSAASANVDYLAQYVVQYTVEPEDCTQPVVWTTSNQNISVDNGVVTANGIGTAVITATCGDFSANISITVGAVTAAMDMHEKLQFSFNTDYVTLRSTSSDLYKVYGTDGTGRNHALWSDAATKAIGEIFMPYLIPKGTSNVRVTCPSTSFSLIAFADSMTEASAGNGGAKILNSDTALVAGSRTIPVPSGVDSVFVGVKNTNGEDVVIAFE